MTQNEQQGQQQSLSNWLCSSSSSEQAYAFMQSNTGGAGIDLPGIGGFDFSAGYATNQSSFEQWQASSCSSYVNNLNTSQLLQSLTHITDNRSNISAWSSCVAQVAASYQSCLEANESVPGVQAQGLTLAFDATSEPKSGDSFGLLVRWCGTGGDISANQAVITVPLSVMGATCAALPSTTLSIGEVAVACTRTGTAEVYASLSAAASISGATVSYDAHNYLRALMGQLGESCRDSSQPGPPCDPGLQCSSKGVCVGAADAGSCTQPCTLGSSTLGSCCVQ